MARATIPLSAQYSDFIYAPDLYLIINTLSNPFLIAGLIQYCRSDISSKWIWLCTPLMELWLFVCWCTSLPLWGLQYPFAVFNFFVYLFVAWLVRQHAAEFTSSVSALLVVASVLNMLHWLLGYPLISAYPVWDLIGFVVGTFLMLTLYLGLLASVLINIQRRLEDAEASALDMAYHDPLTGLKNKRYMVNLFEHVVTLTNRPHHLMAVIYIDLDNFKPINDSAGHEAGDVVLKTVADRLRACTRSTDICVRVGGDEFVIVATQLENPEQVEQVAGKLHECICEPVEYKNKTYQLGASIGVSLYPSHGTDLQELVNLADRAMYQVKSDCKGHFRLHAT